MRRQIAELKAAGCAEIGVRQVRRYALTGERFGAEDARGIGRAHRCGRVFHRFRETWIHERGTLEHFPNFAARTATYSFRTGGFRVAAGFFDRLRGRFESNLCINESYAGITEGDMSRACTPDHGDKCHCGGLCRIDF